MEFEERLKSLDDQTLKRWYHGLRNPLPGTPRAEQFMAVCREIQSRCNDTYGGMDIKAIWIDELPSTV